LCRNLPWGHVHRPRRRPVAERPWLVTPAPVRARAWQTRNVAGAHGERGAGERAVNLAGTCHPRPPIHSLGALLLSPHRRTRSRRTPRSRHAAALVMSTHFVCFAKAHGIFFHAVFRRCTHHTQGRVRVKRHGVVGTQLAYHSIRPSHTFLVSSETRCWESIDDVPGPSRPSTNLPDTTYRNCSELHVGVNTRTHGTGTEDLSACMWRHRASRALRKCRFRESNDAASQS
jgi:hypothetical protein